MSLTAAERETVIVWTDEDDKIMITSCQRKIITKLEKIAGFEVENDIMVDGTRQIMGTLPLGSITFRTKAAGTIKRSDNQNPGKNVARCGEPTAKGTPCQGIASKATGKCAKHSK